MAFSHTFKHARDTCYFAHSYPYTFTNLQRDLWSLEQAPPGAIRGDHQGGHQGLEGAGLEGSRSIPESPAAMSCHELPRAVCRGRVQGACAGAGPP